MIKGRLIGGIGNQLFIYAACKALALRNDFLLGFDVTSGFMNDKKYRRTDLLSNLNLDFHVLPPQSRIMRKILIAVSLPLPLRFKIVYKETIDGINKILFFRKLKRGIFLEGYFQDYRYFEDYSDIIRSEIIGGLRNYLGSHRLYDIVKSSESIAVHLRFFDEQDGIAGSHLSEDYYEHAFKIIRSSVVNPVFVVFSDNPSRAALFLANLLSENEMIIVDGKYDTTLSDLGLMTECKHFVIANSTFSWWGAWLAEHKGKIVCVPNLDRFEPVGFWNLQKMIPDAWIKVSTMSDQK